MIRRALALLALAAPAHAVDVSGSTVTMQATTRPGALAEIVLENSPSNGLHDTGRTFPLEHDGLSVEARFHWNYSGDDDAVIITPPEGIICVPYNCELVVPESQTGTLWLYRTDAVGM